MAAILPSNSANLAFQSFFSPVEALASLSFSLPPALVHGSHASRCPRQHPQDVRMRPTTPRTSAERHAVRHPTRRTATQPQVARSDRRLDGGWPLRPLVGVAVGRSVDGRVDGLVEPSAWAVRQGPSSRGRPLGPYV
jgi:hypothetical protein